MKTPTLNSRDGAAVDKVAIETFRRGFYGQALLPGDAGYDSARRIWNASIDKHPGLIARCSEAADVVRAVKFSRANNLLVAVKSGGHNVAGRALCDDGIVIDLSAINGVSVDPELRTVRVQAGALLGDVDRETHPHGLAVPTGVVSTAKSTENERIRPPCRAAIARSAAERQACNARLGHGAAFVAGEFHKSSDTPFVRDFVAQVGCSHTEVVLDSRELASPDLSRAVMQTADFPVSISGTCFRRFTGFSTGASASLRGKATFAAFAAAKAGLRVVSQSFAREFGPSGIHVVHVIVDGSIAGDKIFSVVPDMAQRKGPDGLIRPEAIADAYWYLHTQHRSAWSQEIDLRPYSESF